MIREGMIGAARFINPGADPSEINPGAGYSLTRIRFIPVMKSISISAITGKDDMPENCRGKI